jgi:hypothetical protein
MTSMSISIQIVDVIEKLSDERKSVIYKLAIDMLSAQELEDFDNYSPEEIEEILDARKQIEKGDCLSFASPKDLKAHFNI